MHSALVTAPLVLQKPHLEILAIKRQRAADQSVEYDTQTPDVHLRPVILLSLEELRGSVRRRATESVQLGSQRELIAEAEICNLDVGVGIQQKVLRLKSGSHSEQDVWRQSKEECESEDKCDLKKRGSRRKVQKVKKSKY